jgi:hypothetical protein
MSRHAFLVMFALLAPVGHSLAQPAAQTASPAAATSKPNPTEDVKVGDRWTYEARDEISGEVKSTVTHIVTDISKSDINVRVNVTGSPGSGYITYDRFWNVKDNGTWRTTPHDGSGIRLPLEVGKTWTFQATEVNSSRGMSYKRSGRAKIVGQETITTRAGTFETYKIEETHTSTNSNDPTRKIELVQQTWYAPEINHWVKRTYVGKVGGRTHDSNSAELVEYGRR